MADKFKLDRIEWNWAGWNEVRRSPGVQAMLEEEGKARAERAGRGYKVITYPSRVVVVAYTREAERDNLKNNTLLKSGR